MDNKAKKKALLAKLEELAVKKTNRESDPYYCAADNGNYDDAHSDGADDGEIQLAREILPVIKELLS